MLSIYIYIYIYIFNKINYIYPICYNNQKTYNSDIMNTSMPDYIN